MFNLVLEQIFTISKLKDSFLEISYSEFKKTWIKT